MYENIFKKLIKVLSICLMITYLYLLLSNNLFYGNGEEFMLDEILKNEKNIENLRIHTEENLDKYLIIYEIDFFFYIIDIKNFFCKLFCNNVNNNISENISSDII